ncbi:MAG: hypothetical protein AAF081_17725 [Actinomycetota bacterium]
MRTGLYAAAAAVGVVATSCTFGLRDPGTVVACDPIDFEINTHGEAVSDEALTAVVDTFTEFGDLVGRDVVYLGPTEATQAGHTPDDPVLVEFIWPDDAPDELGYASPTIRDGEYVSGWMYLHPVIGEAPDWLVRRLVLHEIGHLNGLLDVNDPTQMMDPGLATDTWGTGDLAGLAITTDLGCNDSPNLVQAMLAADAGTRSSGPPGPDD